MRKKPASVVVALSGGVDSAVAAASLRIAAYFMHRLNQPFLSKAVFPLGETTKDEVRKQALEMGLPVHSVPESQ